MKIDLTEKEINLIKRALTNNSVESMDYANDEYLVKELGEQWQKQMKKQSDDMIALVNKLIGKELRVFQMNDYDWCVTDGFVEDINEWYENNQLGDENDIEDVRLCDLDKEGMWYIAEDVEDIKALGEYDERISGEWIDGVYKSKPKFGDLMRRDGEVYKYISFREALVKEGEYKEPYIISTTEW